MKWRTVKIGDLLTERRDRFKPTEANEIGLPRIEKIDFSGNIHIIENKQTKTGMILVKTGDLVISGINVQKGAIAVYQEKKDVTATIHYSSYTYDEKQIDIEYLKWFLKSPAFIDVINTQSKSGIKREIKPKTFLSLQIELPNLSTQKEIVAIIDKNVSNIDDFQTEQQTQKQLIKQLRQAILQEAVQGKLVAQNPDDEPASELLKRIKAEKQALIAAKEISKEKYLPPIEKKDLPFELPKGWVWCRLGEVAHQCLGKMLDKSKNKGIPTLYLRNTNVRWFEFELNDVNLMKFEPSELERFSIKKGDILICEGGEPGRAAIWEQEDLGYKFQKALHRVRFYDGVDSKYFVYYLYFIAKRKILDKLFTGMTIKHLTGQSLKILPIPLPPLSEQKRIVEKVEKLLQYCEALEEEIENSVGNAEVLMQSVLQEAFKER